MHLRRRCAADIIPDHDHSSPLSSRRQSKRLQRNIITVPLHSKKTTTNGNGHQVPPPKMTQSDPAASPSRRHVKRKAAAAPAPQSQVAHENLLQEALRPLTAQEIEEWDGWVELESEPAFFNTILKELGIKHVKVQELFTLDPDSLKMLPKPVFGLIFLFQYSPFLDDAEAEDEDEDPPPVWFANQTISNACATVAMLNIVMNHATIDLGTEIQAFKAATAHMTSPIRGYELSRNKFIRKTHNAFARRMDCLNADLYLEHESSAKNSRKRTPQSRVASGKRNSKKARGDDYGYHFIAYVPCQGFVWELDGLKGKPRKLDSFGQECWTSVARPQIEARILQYEESQLSFNLLSICQSPLKALRTCIMNALVAVRHVDARMQAQHGTAYTQVVSNSSDMDMNLEDATLLAEFDLKPQDIETNTPHPVTLETTTTTTTTKTQDGTLSLQEAATLRSELVAQARAAMGDYRGETMLAKLDGERVAARKKDFGRALHKWVSKLADKGVLQDFIQSS